MHLEHSAKLREIGTVISSDLFELLKLLSQCCTTLQCTNTQTVLLLYPRAAWLSGKNVGL